MYKTQCVSTTDESFLNRIADRLVEIHLESPGVDYIVVRLRQIAREVGRMETERQTEKFKVGGEYEEMA